jgi:hypothetical protein
MADPMSHPRHSRSLLLALAMLACGAAAGEAQSQVLPFAVGEKLVYQARAPHGLRGKATMWIEGPAAVRGVETMVLRFDFATKVGFVTISDRTTSWLDPLRMAAMRFDKQEVRFLARHNEHVEMEPASREWTEADGRTGQSPTSQPLDELSFIDPARNPTVVRSLGKGQVETPLGTFITREVEMRVRDARNYKGEGVIRFSFSDDACRRPVRIQSTIPDAGTVVMTLSSATPAAAACTAEGQ